MVVVLGLVAALLYGVSDFFGGLASRTRPAPVVSLVALAVCTVVVLPALAVTPSVWSWQAIVFGALAGATAGVGVLLLYAALAAGPVGFVSPVVALLTAVLPSGYAVAIGERPTLLGIVAIATVVAGGVLIGVEPDLRRRPSPRTAVMTVVTGIVYASYFVFMNATPPDSGAVPMVSDSVAAVVVVGAIVLARHEHVPRAGGRDIAVMLGAGATQGVATVLLVLALHLPGLAIVSALSALYPVTTVLLAVAVLRERLRWWQAAGLVVAVAGVALLAASRP